MAIQAHFHQNNNLGLPISSSQDYFYNNSLINNTNMMSNNNNNMFYNGCGLNELSYNNMQVQYQQQQQQYMSHLQNMQRRNSCMENSFGGLQPMKKQKLEMNNIETSASTTKSESDYYLSMNIPQSLSLENEKQGKEINRFVNLQNERLKVALQEQRKQQIGAIIRKLEAKALQLLKQKDDEILQANKKTMELQEIIRKMELENQAWQKIALENEAIVFSLTNTLEQLKQQQEVCSSSSSNSSDDNESRCNFFDNNKNIIRGYKEETCGGFVEETVENRGIFGLNDGKNATKREELCKVCNCRNACVLLLPCRHLCCCKVCDGFIDACPLCKSPKKASIEALIS